jgi:hypothetical protein
MLTRITRQVSRLLDLNIFKKKVSITKTDFKKRIKDIFMTFTLWNSDQKLRESYREVLFWGRMECLT